MRDAENASHEGKKKYEMTWPIFQITHQRTRYIYDLYYEKEAISKGVYSVALQMDGVAEQYLAYAERLRPLVADASLLVNETLDQGRSVLFEGAQGSLLDIDHGTYPFVTSSNATAGGACTGLGVSPTRITAVVGVTKAYTTRVGEGPFPTEMPDLEAREVRDRGKEYGAVTGRPRRCGWLDLVALRYAVRLNGITSLALTKLDVLSAFAEIPVCVRYRLPDGSETSDFPAHQSDFHHCRPVYEVLAGWTQALEDDLPDAARTYVEFVERQVERHG